MNNISIPSKFYKYFGGFGQDNRNLRTITDSLLWYQNPTKLNDPFDSRPAISGRNFDYAFNLAEKTIQSENWVIDKYGTWKRGAKYTIEPRQPNRSEVIGFAKSLMDKEVSTQSTDWIYPSYGVCCFSKDPINILMWSHYGQEHTGFVLEFDITKTLEIGVHGNSVQDDIFDLVPSPVIYNQNRPPSDESALTIKSPDWVYEQEVRVLQPLGQGLYPYDRSILKSVIMGSRSSKDTLRTMIQTLEYVRLKYDFDIPIHHCFEHETKYKIIIPGRPELDR